MYNIIISELRSMQIKHPPLTNVYNARNLKEVENEFSLKRKSNIKFDRNH